MNGDAPHANGDDHTNTEPRPDSTAATSGPSTLYISTCLLGYSLSFIIFGSQVSILGPTINPLAEHLGVSEADLSPLFTALGISCIVSGTPSGWLVDRLPTHHVLVGSLLVEALGFSLVPFMTSVWSLTALYFVICFSYNFTNSAVFTSLGWMFPKKAGSALNLVLAMFGVGSFCIPLAAQACRNLLGDPLAVFWVVSAVSLLAVIPFLFVASPQPPTLDLSSDVASSKQHHSTRLQLLEQVVTVGVVVLVFFTTAAETAVGNWIYTFGLREADLTNDEAALANSVFWGFFTIGRVAGVAVSHVLSPAWVIMSFVPLAVLGASLPIWAMPLLGPWWLVITTAALSGLGNSTGYASAVSLLERYVPVTGFINGVFGMVAGGACMVGPTAVALLATHTSLRYVSMAWVGTLFYLLQLPLTMLVVSCGTPLLELQQSVDSCVEDGLPSTAAADEESGSVADEKDTLAEPLLSRGSLRRASQDIGGAGHDRERGSAGTPSSRPVFMRRVSIPGHASPIAGSMG